MGQPWGIGNERNVVTPLRSNGKPYRGINIFLLWDAAILKNYGCNIWMTYKQALELNANVRKGEKGTSVVYANKATKLEKGDDRTEKESSYAFLKSYTVFNVEQIEGLPVGGSASTAEE